MTLAAGTPVRLLILGGTGDGHRLAKAAISVPQVVATTSLAGRTRRPRLPPGRVRIGGFGGAAGLSAYLARSAIDVVIDATHPFSTRISENARIACAAAGTPLVEHTRPPWTDDICAGATVCADEGEALARAAAIPGRALVTFLPDGASDLPIARDRLVVRSLAVPRRLPAGATWIPFRPGAGANDERARLESLGIRSLVAKASGGPMVAKLGAAKALGLSIILLRRPGPPPDGAVTSTDEALALALARARER